MKFTSKKFRISALAGACAVAIGATSVVAINAVSATNPDDDDTANEPAQPTDCTIEALPTPEGAVSSRVIDVDSSGSYILGSFDTLNADGYYDSEPIIWHDGEITDPFDLPADRSYFDAINAEGVAIGTVKHPVGDEQITPTANTYHDGESIDLEDELNSQGLGINDHHDLVGNIDHHETNVPQAAVFIEDGNEILDVPDDIFSSSASDIDNDGNIVGYVDEGDFGYPYRWSADGEGEELTLPDEDDYSLNDAPRAINNGTTVGSAQDEGEKNFAVIWELDETDGTVTELERPGGINAEGWVTGGHGLDAAVYVDGETFNLPRLDDGSDVADYAVGISDDGSIIGGTVSYDALDGDRGEAVTWTCS